MQDNIKEIITNALLVKKDNLTNLKEIVENIKKALEKNKEAIYQANKIDEKNNNGFIMDFTIINNIIANLENVTPLYGDVTLSSKDNKTNIIYGKQIMDIGNVIVITDGNPYITIEMALRNILAVNTTIIMNNGYMYGTNKLIIEIIKTVLEQNNLPKNLIQIYISEEYTELLNNFANIDLVICIGNQSLQREILSKSKNKTITSGYENYEIYIEDTTNIDFLNKIINTGLNIQLYINKDLNIDYEKAIIVNDIDEAIASINYTGSRYSSAIFTTSKANASQFIKQVKSKITTINTSPTIERIIDIKQTDLTNEKTIIYPFNFQLNGKRDEINIHNQEQ